MQQPISELREQFRQALTEVVTTTDLEDLKVKFLGKKGSLQQLVRLLKDLSEEQRPLLGKEINDLKEFIVSSCESTGEELLNQEEKLRISGETLDETLPGRRQFVGRKHPLNQVLGSIVEILSDMGFSIQIGPEIDSDYYNFEALNFPPEHPARDMQDTFYLSPEMLLRTHTSNIQARVMEANRPPIRIIAPGKVYRNEAITARSHVFFNQIEAIYIDTKVTFGDLIGTMDLFLEKLFKRSIATRYRPSFFPFVEPGMEIDIGCLACEGKGCGLCKHSGWLEIAGAGMIHPEVLRNGGIDPELYTGFAWGMGLERVTMLLYPGISDIRLFTQNDLGFLSQFRTV